MGKIYNTVNFADAKNRYIETFAEITVDNFIVKAFPIDSTKFGVIAVIALESNLAQQGVFFTKLKANMMAIIENFNLLKPKGAMFVGDAFKSIWFGQPGNDSAPGVYYARFIEDNFIQVLTELPFTASETTIDNLLANISPVFNAFLNENGKADIILTEVDYSFGNRANGGSYTQKVATVAGTGLTANIIFTKTGASAGKYGFSKTVGGTYTNTLEFAPDELGVVAAQDVWMKFTPAGTGAMNIDGAVNSTHAETVAMPITGTGV